MTQAKSDARAQAAADPRADARTTDTHAKARPDARKEAGQEALYRVLDGLGIAYTVTGHEAAFTVEQADRLYGHLPGAHARNLFLRNKRGQRHYLVVAGSHTPVNLRALRDMLDESTLSFASPERLMRYLGLNPGSVSPFGLINDREHAVRVILDRHLLDCETLNFHPNVNTATLTLSRTDFERFLAACGNEVRRVTLPGAPAP
jgi:Ala-tRNA(Pro) deacylase